MEDQRERHMNDETGISAADNDPFEQGKLARFNHEPRKNPYPEDSEQYERWEAGYKFIEQGLVAV